MFLFRFLQQQQHSANVLQSDSVSTVWTPHSSSSSTDIRVAVLLGGGRCRVSLRRCCFSLQCSFASLFFFYFQKTLHFVFSASLFFSWLLTASSDVSGSSGSSSSSASLHRCSHYRLAAALQPTTAAAATVCGAVVQQLWPHQQAQQHIASLVHLLHSTSTGTAFVVFMLHPRCFLPHPRLIAPVFWQS